jgi:hypothetical protein
MSRFRAEAGVLRVSELVRALGWVGGTVTFDAPQGVTLPLASLAPVPFDEWFDEKDTEELYAVEIEMLDLDGAA